MIINHNMSAINANKVLKFKHWDVNKSMETLASGMRINKAGDDASGLAVSEKMRTQIQGLRQAERNTEDGMSFVQTTEGYLNQTSEILQRIRVLAVQSSNGIYSLEDRQLIQVEVSQLVDEVDRIASQAESGPDTSTCAWVAPGVGGDPRQPAEHAHRRRVEIRPLAPPLPDDPVDGVARRRFGDGRMLCLILVEHR